MIPIELCQRETSCRVMAGDAAVSMLELARYRVEAACHTQRIQLVQLDAKRLGFADDMFDMVISNSIVHHIPEPRAVFAEAIRVLRTGGLLFFRDLLRPHDEAEHARLVEIYAADATEPQRQLFADSLHAVLTLDEVQRLVASCGGSPFAVRHQRSPLDMDHAQQCWRVSPVLAF